MDWDVIVVGLGTAGTSAALAAAKLGLRTLGVERTNMMGGQYTAGGICFGQRPPVVAMHEFEREAEKLGLARAYETVPLAVGKSGGRFVSVTLVSGGRVREESAKVFVDATGSATLARLAGMPTRKGRPRDGATARCARSELWKKGTGEIIPYYKNYAVDLCGDSESYSKAMEFLAGTRVEEFRRLKKIGRMLRPAVLAGGREELRYVTERIVTFRDLLNETPWPDVIFHGFGPEDYVSPDGRLAYESDDIQNWKVICYLPAFGYPYAIPYGTIVAKGVDNLLVPSKHLGVSHDCGGTVRMQAEMRSSGAAAACAAKVMLSKGCAARDVPYADLKPLLDRERTLSHPRQTAVDTVNGYSFGRRFTADEIVAALSVPTVRSGEWWNSKAQDGPGERASYAYWNCWKTALSGTAEDRKSLADRLAAEMAKGGAGEGNFAVALGLMDDRRCLPALRAIVRHPGGAADPTGPRIYPNRMKALAFLGRMRDATVVPELRAILSDGARAFTSGVVTTDVFASGELCRAAAAALAEVALERIEGKRAAAL
ncbi:MAG: FAD-dependent oxidoreductase [Kiritimatiellae bacterium]|nr:FAD-dependent oxidoreductase [Kiritimatiellia bacterium]